MDEVVTNDEMADKITTAYGIDDSAEIPAVEKDKEYEQIDDESTTEEDEALSEMEEPLRELNSLQEESNMSIHELMRLYNYPNNTPTKISTKKQKMYKNKSSRKKIKDNKRKKKNSISSDSIAKKRIKSTEKQKLDDDIVENENTDEGNSSSCETPDESPKENENIEKAEIGDDSSELLSLFMAEIDQGQSEIEDDDYKPHGEKSVNVGTNFQALVPDVLSTYSDVLSHEKNDELLWDPNVLNEDLIEDYLIKIHEITKALKPKSKTIGVRDNEKALYLLVQCGYDVTEAIRRVSLNTTPVEKLFSDWSEDEITVFEEELVNKGKNFHAIQKEVKTKSVSELVHFYYFWKKTVRSGNTFEERSKTQIMPK